MRDTIRPSAAWYLVAAGIVVVSVGAIAFLTLRVLDDVVGMFNPHLLPGPGRHQVRLEEAGPYTIYVQVDRRSASARDAAPRARDVLPGLEVEVRDAGGSVLPLGAPSDAMVARRNTGFLPWAGFEAKHAGSFEVAVARGAGAEDEPFTLAVGKSISASDVTSVIGHLGGAWIVLFVGGGAALAVFLVTLLRRRDSRRRLEAEAVANLLADRRDG